MKVWIVETGEYSMRGVWGVYSSPDAAVERIKATYSAPYVVEWKPLTVADDGSFELVGHFASVPGKSAQHVGCYDGRAWELDSWD